MTTNTLLRCVLACCVVLGNVLPILAQSAPKKLALLAGVNVYQKRGFSNLDYAERDATALDAELKKLGFTTVLLTGSGAGPLQATRQNIDAQLLKLLADTGKQDIVLVALSGHGQQLTVKSAGSEREDNFFCPYDAEKDSPGTQFSLSYLTDEVLAKKGGRNLVLVDACRDEIKDAGRGSKGVQGKIVALPEDTAILFSCRAGQRSWENDELKHGVFTYCVLDGLRGGAAKGNDIAWTNLVAHVDEQMASVEMKRYLGKVQEPISAGGVGRTILGSLKPPTPGEKLITSKSTGMKLTLIPAEMLLMDSPVSEGERSTEVGGKPHSAKISKSFYMGVHEVTQAEFESMMGTNPSAFSKTGSSKIGVSGMETGRFPVESVTWFDAIEFCHKLSLKDGLTPYYTLKSVTQESGSITSATIVPTNGNGYRLPTEVEWEYACRAGTTTPFHFGGVLNGDHANVDGNSPFGTTTKGKHLKRAAAVGSYTANAFGLFDMHGNVWEWCLSNSDALNQPYRGGSWMYPAKDSKAGSGDFYKPDSRFNDLGFRVVLPVTTSK